MGAGVGGGEERMAGVSIVFILKFLLCTKRPGDAASPGVVLCLLFAEDVAGRLLIYLFAAYLFIYLPRALFYDFQHLFPCSSPFLFVQKGKVQSGSVSRGRSLLNTNPPAPACADLDRGAINGSIANPHVCFVRPGREGSGLT